MGQLGESRRRTTCSCQQGGKGARVAPSTAGNRFVWICFLPCFRVTFVVVQPRAFLFLFLFLFIYIVVVLVVVTVNNYFGTINDCDVVCA